MLELPAHVGKFPVPRLAEQPGEARIAVVAIVDGAVEAAAREPHEHNVWPGPHAHQEVVDRQIELRPVHRAPRQQDVEGKGAEDVPAVTRRHGRSCEGTEEKVIEGDRG